MCCFAGIKVMSNQIVDQTTILSFRHLLENHGLEERSTASQKTSSTRRLKHTSLATEQPAETEQLGHGHRCQLDRSAKLQKQGMKAGFSDAPDRVRQRVGSPLAEGCAYGMKVHAGVDQDSGRIHSVSVTAANVRDLIPATELLQGDEEVVYGVAAGF